MENITSSPLAAGSFLQTIIAFYLGYFGAGAGILILAMLALLGMDLLFLELPRTADCY